ncbi:alpha/beta hydrolase [Cytophagaceae bacterium YF14B1]|uniref:Alpha/beta hydrolase n=2 Tax=Xanthocytophaga flava TaxID=3048013 RepID=A0AAE3U9B1_9BACT|nr:alpha/beta hydrolase [Xanthocytophaga flavus]
MPYLQETTYRSPFYLFNGHLQTIIPAVMRKVNGISYYRERITTPDEDFLDLDWAFAENKRKTEPTPLAIISHGLEGDSQRPYVTGMVRMLTSEGYDVLAWNYRSCSGEINRQRRFYHIGATDDLHTVVEYITQMKPEYTEIVLLGFSAGGNITLKYLGEQGALLAPFIKKSVVFSVPLDVKTSSAKISKPQNFIYEQRFLRSLRKKILKKAEIMPQEIDIMPLQTIRKLKEFDDVYTAPLHGFKDAVDYYTRNSSKFFLQGIKVPTLIVNAINDPFLSPECFDQSLVTNLPNVWLQITQAGGHCGFMYQSLQNTFWSETRALSFLKESHF